MTDCRAITHLLGAYLDGQLDAVTTLEVGEHVGACETCRERVELDRATRASLQRALKNDPAPEGLQARMLAAMTATAAESKITAVDEAAGGEPVSHVPASRPAMKSDGGAEVERLFGWRTMLPISAAAALALVWGSVARPPGDRMQSVRMGIDDPLADLVAEHSRPLPNDFNDQKDMHACEQYIGVPVRPARLERAGARWVGARIMPVHQERAAVLHYEISQGSQVRRVSLFVYDPRRIQVGSTAPELSPRAVGTAELLVGRTGGYSVAVTQRAGVGYALASDLDAEGSAQLAALIDED